MSAAVMNGCMYLLDAHSLIFQVFHAIPEMSSPTGTPTNRAIRVLAAICWPFAWKKSPTIWSVPSICPGLLFATRSIRNIRLIASRCPTTCDCKCPSSTNWWKPWGFPLLSVPSFEADDVVATVAKAASASRDSGINLHHG